MRRSPSTPEFSHDYELPMTVCSTSGNGTTKSFPYSKLHKRRMDRRHRKLIRVVVASIGTILVFSFVYWSLALKDNNIDDDENTFGTNGNMYSSDIDENTGSRPDQKTILNDGSPKMMSNSLGPEPRTILSGDNNRNATISNRESSFEKKSNFGGAVNPGYFLPEDAIVAGGNSFKFAAITDLDKLSRVKDDFNNPLFHAMILPGRIHHLPEHTNSKQKSEYYTVTFDQPQTLTTALNDGGRGAEYSELTLFDHRLLTVDDRTGAVVELLHSQNIPDKLVPITRYIFTEGNGEHNSKGMKWEWALVKDDELYIGGIGKEMQYSNGDVDHANAMWIAIIGRQGQVRRVDWSAQYNFVRRYMGCQLPGYMAHEAILWSHHLRKWVFLPRRVSTHQYVADLDERLGSNKVIIVDEEFSHAKVIEIDLQHHEAGLRGFSSFAFVPNTQDQHVLALRSVEEDCVSGNSTSCQFRTYICAFELLSGDVLMEEVLMDQAVKFEGLEFVDLYTKPPSHFSPKG